MPRRLLKPLLIAVLSTFIAASVVARQRPTSTSDEGDWPMFSRDCSGSRFSPLADINTGNVAQLAQAWSVQLTAAGRTPRRGASAGGGAGAQGEARLRRS